MIKITLEYKDFEWHKKIPVRALDYTALSGLGVLLTCYLNKIINKFR